MVNSSKLEAVQPQGAQLRVQELAQRAVRGLPQMLDPASGVFCYTLKKTANGMVREGVSPRYTAMTLMGLARAEQKGLKSNLDTELVMKRLLANSDWVNNVGDLGLLLWLCAQLAPQYLPEIEKRFPLKSALSRFPDVAEGVTMYLAWFLTGLSYMAQISGNTSKNREVAIQTYNLLIRNQGQGGFFGHLAESGSMKGRLRGAIGSFADQVYPIYALSQYSLAFGDDPALQKAIACARGICEAQGSLGQWWWHYNSRCGRVFEEYPVYSVHQHGMAPMTLLAVGKVSRTSFDSWIYKGIDWIDRRNELAFDMEDEATNVIWRCIQPSKAKRYVGALFGSRAGGMKPEQLSVNYECRPYELGWLLYALAPLLQD